MDKKTVNAWIAVRSKTSKLPRAKYTLTLGGSRALYEGVGEGDWVLVTSPIGEALSVGRVYRSRTTPEGTTFYFDKQHISDAPLSLSAVGFSLPTSGQMGRLQWTDFTENLEMLFGLPLGQVKLISEIATGGSDRQHATAYIRELLQLSVADDLLGPAMGPTEQILDMSVRDRYLVGRLAPRDDTKGGIEGLEGPMAPDDVDPDSPMEVHTGEHDTGAEFASTTGRVDAEAESSEEIDATSNQSLIPSSFGLTICVDGDVDSIQVEARWGRYERFYDHEIYKTRLDPETGEEIQGQKAKVWQRIPCGGVINLALETGVITHQAPDNEHPEVRIQGRVRDKNENGDQLVTLFLVNTQEEPEENKDSAWIFQPEILCRAQGDDTKAIFRRRPVLKSNGDDEEREALEMIYREHVEFAVGHGVAVHAKTAENNPEQALEIRTVVMPEYEVPVTEVPGLKPEDRPAMQRLVREGHLDMQRLATMERTDLVDALQLLTEDYGQWIVEQANRVGGEIVGHDSSAKAALSRCKEIKTRLEEGIAVLADTDNAAALEAFRFANQAMAKQRVHSKFALEQRRNNKSVTLESLWDDPKNYSWRSFQLAFVLLSIPAMADPTHKDRTSPAESFADLLWFPTGGGKTEAYLGVAAFAMAIRRFQGNLGGYDASRGLSVIMRYTLRLLTLQQFQRGTALICAMEVIRRGALKAGDDSLGKEPFTIGLWVGNRVTPGTTADSDTAIKGHREKKLVSSSPAQLTSCPWCGSEIARGRDIEVNVHKGQTTIYCGDKMGRCTFSKGQSASEPHPGIPALVVDEEIYHRPPSMMIATVDKFAMMAWRGETRTLFGKARAECPRHGLLWPDAKCSGTHRGQSGLPAVKTKAISPVRPPDLIIQDEFHLISGPLGTMVGLYETAVDELSTWDLDGQRIKPKVIASTATVRKAEEQVNGVFMRKLSVFPPHGLDVEDNFFSVQRSIEDQPGRLYMGVCSPGSSRPAVLIRAYTAFLTASQALFDRFGQIADPYLTSVGYFNSLRELGGMKRLAEDDVQTRAYRVQMSLVQRPGLAQRSVRNISELTSRVSSQDIPKRLDELEIKFKAEYDTDKGKFVSKWEEGEDWATDVVLATNMLSVGVDVNRIGLMTVNGQPKGTAEYIQATSRVGRAFPGLVCTVLTWARPRDLSHYETFEHYHATFYKHVEAQSVTPFSPRALDRGLTGTMLSLMRLDNETYNPNEGAGELKNTAGSEIKKAVDALVDRASMVVGNGISESTKLAAKTRIDEWHKEASVTGRSLAYEKKGKKAGTTVALIKSPGIKAWDWQTVPMSMREVEPGVKLMMNTKRLGDGPDWKPKPVSAKEESDS